MSSFGSMVLHAVRNESLWLAHTTEREGSPLGAWSGSE